MVKKQVILIVSDLHEPYSHPDTLEFLKACKKKFKPTQVVFSGDEVDSHAISFHDSDPNLPSAGDELKQAIGRLKPIYKLFPKAYILESNHGSLIYRKALANGLPKEYFKDYNDILRAPKSWKWVNDLTLNTPQGKVYFHHSRGKAIKTAQTYGMSHVCGHHHESFDIQYWSTPEKLMFGMTVGCLVDKKSLALAYNKINLKRPILGLGVIIDGVPQLVPMLLDKHGMWVGNI
jgi:hypothetical protein